MQLKVAKVFTKHNRFYANYVSVCGGMICDVRVYVIVAVKSGVGFRVAINVVAITLFWSIRLCVCDCVI